ncbi:hypothetical protein [Oscillibacter sp. GMB15532]|uniref:hypothetical protein n=1 Tax=Oscillibacter sp. GMB15532 TaxID=3230022 RepID=UPI0034DE82B9
MKYLTIALVIAVGLLAHTQISTLKGIIKNQEKRLNQLAKLTGHGELSSFFVSDQLKEELVQLKQNGKIVKAVKKLREQTQMDLLKAKQYIDN